MHPTNVMLNSNFVIYTRVLLLKNDLCIVLYFVGALRKKKHLNTTRTPYTLER